MPKYVIEGEMPGARELSGEETIMTLPKIRIWPLMFVLLGTVAACTSQTSQEIEVTRVVEVEADLPAWIAAREATEAFVSIEAAEAADYRLHGAGSRRRDGHPLRKCSVFGRPGVGC